jgi:uncharacterized membrane protein SpoIIM required for sporulation
MSAKGTARPSLIASLALSLALLCAGLATGFQTSFGTDPVKGPNGGGVSWWDAFVGVVAVNAPALALLYGGALTAGVVTLIAWPILAIYIGATLRASMNLIGAEKVFSTIWVYAPLEFLAMAIGASAGLMPLLSALWTAFFPQSEERPLRAYLGEIPSTLRMIGIALGLMLLAAGIEASVIVLNPALEGRNPP